MPTALRNVAVNRRSSTEFHYPLRPVEWRSGIVHKSYFARGEGLGG